MLLIESEGLNIEKLSLLREDESGIGLFSEPDQVALGEPAGILATDLPRVLQNSLRLIVDLVTALFGQMDHNSPRYVSTKPIDSPGPLRQGVECGALGVHDVVVELERDFHDLGGDQQSRLSIEDLPFLTGTIPEDELGVVTHRIEPFAELRPDLGSVERYSQR